MNRDELGGLIRELREDRGWRQQDLANLVDTQQNRVNDWEHGNHLPTLPLLERIAAAFDMSVSQFLRGIM